jgi:pilus assembly protein CpaC
MMFRSTLLALATSLTLTPMALAQNTSSSTMQVHITAPGNGPAAQTLDLPLSKAAVIHLPVDAVDVLVTNPDIADAVIRTSRRAYILGQGIGQTNAFFFDANGELIVDLDIRVERDMRALQTSIDRFLPDARIQVEAMNNHIVLSGMAPDASSADSALQLARRWVDNPENVLSMIAVQGRQQVMLNVRIVEMQRTIVRQLGINLSAAAQLDDLAVSVATEQQFSLVGRALSGLSSNLTYNNTGGGDISSVTGLVQALERVGLVRTLAEPNLTAISGEPANFLAGGEFPVPTGRDRDGNIMVEYKQFGVGLGFTPMVLSEGRISLRISTEVSELSSQGSLELGASTTRDDQGNITGVVEGVTIPALNVNRAETTVELPSGGSLVLAGLIQEETRQNLDGVPGVQNLPVLGALFRSRDFENQETELVVIVTPYLVDPVNGSSLETPAQGFATASEIETFLFGHINRVYAVPGAHTDGQSWDGPVGFLFD